MPDIVNDRCHAVNNYLSRIMYGHRMRPGPKRGVPKPLKRQLDPEFHSRLRTAMQTAGVEVPQLARDVGCTRAALHKYLDPGKSKHIEALLLSAIAERLRVSAKWLLLNEGNMGVRKSLHPDEEVCLEIFSAIKDREARESWITQGRALSRLFAERRKN